VKLRARWVTLRALWVTLRARWVMLSSRWVRVQDKKPAQPTREAELKSLGYRNPEYNPYDSDPDFNPWDSAGIWRGESCEPCSKPHWI
jgi:hypothetical protein